MNERLKALYLLSAARNFTPLSHDALVQHFGALEPVLTCADDALKKVHLKGSQTQRLLEARAGIDIDADLVKYQEMGIKLVGWGDAGYPELLTELPDAPLLLYCKGDTQIMAHHGVAIVGSRKCSDQGRDIAFQFGRDLAELKIPMVSGLAWGIDGSAHDGALSVHGPTVAVLGCGVDVIYPPKHHELYERMCSEALVVSEYMPGSEPHKSHFPQRNRIISGLSKGVLVIEAPMGSGALITARLANEQGREVFAVPGNIRNPYTRGNNSLLKTGQGKLVESIDDILVEFGTNRATLFSERSAAANKSAGASAGNGAAVATGPDLSETEHKLVELVSYEGSHVNDLVRKLGITTSECIAHLTMLEIKGLISSASGGFYVRL